MTATGQDLQAVDEFWTWALGQWRREDLSAGLLDLQNQHGLVVLELLFLAWLGRRGHCLEHSAWQFMVSQAQPWVDEVIVPLRSTRQRWRDRPAVAPLRSLLADLEVRTERQLAVLYMQSLSHILGAGSAQLTRQLDRHSDAYSRLYDNLCLGVSRAQPPLSEQKITQIVQLLHETDEI